MKVICDRPALQAAVNIVGTVVVSRTPSPILRCIRLTAADGVLELAATDAEVSLKLGVEQVDIEEAGEAVIPADKLIQIVRNSEESTLTIYTDDDTVHIKSQDSHFKVFGYDAKEFPKVRDFDDVTVDCELPAGALHRLIHRSLFAAAAEHSRYAINGVLYARDGKILRMVATDGRRLAMTEGLCTGGKDTTTCIIPSKALTLINKLTDDSDAPIWIAVEENQILFRVGEGATAAVLTSNLVEGAFPPYEDVIPKDLDKKIKFDSNVLSSAIRRAALLTNEESKGVRMSFAEKKLTLTSRAPEMGEAEIHVDMNDYEGEPLEIGFNPGFITDALKVVDGGDVIIELKASNKPGVLRAGSDFTYVMMPVNLQ